MRTSLSSSSALAASSRCVSSRDAAFRSSARPAASAFVRSTSASSRNISPRSQRRPPLVAVASAASPSPPSPPPPPPPTQTPPAQAVNKSLPPAITLTPSAVRRCLELKRSKGLEAAETLFLRVGVRSGGCNGMSYTMDFVEEQKPDDHVFEATASTSESGDGEGSGVEGERESVKIVCDPKSLLFLFGLQLDYSDALIGGGFSFQNPNAEGSCGCGKSFNV